MTDNRLYRSRV